MNRNNRPVSLFCNVKKIRNIFAAALILFGMAPGGAFAEWSIGIYQGNSPLSLDPAAGVTNPVLTASDVTDTTAVFVADPFIIEVAGTWYMFFEVLNGANNQGDIAYATSPDGLNWTYQSIILDESFHLSYPQVFESGGEYYMIPETGENGAVTLYRATSFPTAWTLDSTLITGAVNIDPSVFFANGSWWMFVGTTTNDTLHLYYADVLTGPWVEHPNSPLIVGNANIARPGGRVINDGGTLYRVGQDDDPSYGNQIRLFQITDLTRTSYLEVEVAQTPVLGASGFGWNRDGMHHLDASPLTGGGWLAAVDGNGDPLEVPPPPGPGISKVGWQLWAVDSQELVGEDGAAENAFDGSTATFWHTDWASDSPNPPHTLDIYLGGQYSVNGFDMTPRQDGGVNGRIAGYEFYVSLDGVNWGTPVASGTFANDATVKQVNFTAVDAQFVRLRALSEVNGNPWTVVAELDVLGTASAGGGNVPPDGTINSPTSAVTILAGDSVNFMGSGFDLDANNPLTYSWSFGAGSGVADSGLEDPGNVTFNIPGTYTVTFTATDALGLSDPIPATRTITVQDPNASAPLDPTGLSLLSTDSEELVGEDGAAINAFDSDPSTYWHTDWASDAPSHPHNLDIYLGGQYSVDGFLMTPRQDGGSNGNIAGYEFYVSLDGVNWGAPVASGTFVNDATVKQVNFAAVEAQFVRLRALSEVNGNPWTVVAELQVIASAGAGSGNVPPNGTINTPVSAVTIVAGASVNFTGSGSDLDGNTPLAYNWSFGTDSGVTDSALQNPGSLQFNVPGIYTVTFTVTDALGASDPIPATQTVTVQDPNASAPLDSSGWSVLAVDSEELIGEDGSAINAIDGNTATFWHTEWFSNSPNPPHTLDIYLGGQYSVDGFSMTPRQDSGVNGRIAGYEFYVSLDGVNWGTPVAAGTFANDGTVKQVSFTAVEAQFVRLQALSEVNGNPWTVVAELGVSGSTGAGGGNIAPDGYIDTPVSNLTISTGTTVDFFGTGTDADANYPLTYNWSFGAGSEVADSTAEDPGSILFSVPGTYTVTFTVTDALGLSDPVAATRTIAVEDPGAVLIDQSGWTILAVDSEELIGEDGSSVNAIDGNAGTIWHTEWFNNNPNPPHTLDINMGASYLIDGFLYTPRPDSENGRIAGYEFYVSLDGVSWGAPVASGTFVNDGTAKQVNFADVQAQYVRFRALSEVNGSPWTVVAELGVFLSQTPEANAGPDQNVGEGVFVQLDGSGSTDPNSDPLTYLWTQTGGTPATLSSTTAVSPSFTAPVGLIAHETLIFSLVVNDGLSNSVADTALVVVQSAVAPTAVAGPDQTVAEGVTVLLDGTGSFDPNADLLTYSWSQTAGASVLLSDATAISPTFAAPTGLLSDATLIFELIVTDGTYTSVADAVTITVLAPNQPPVANAGSDQVVPMSTGAASLLDFTAQPIDWFQENAIYTNILEQGYTFTSTHMHWVDNPDLCGFGGCVSNGTTYLMEDNTAPVISMSGSTPFTLTSFDGAEVFNLPNIGTSDGTEDYIEVTGIRADGSTVSVDVVIDQLRDGVGGVADFETFTMPATFTNLVSVTFTGRLFGGSPAGSSIDNINVISEGAFVQLNGSSSSDGDSDPLTYMWTQTGGAPVVLSDPTIVNPTFTAPLGLSVDEVLTFQLVVDDGSGANVADTVVVTVQVPVI